ncbi:hypothetical protein HK096_000111, partial [Nowakowskiella sp. JEL0078]
MVSVPGQDVSYQSLIKLDTGFTGTSSYFTSDEKGITRLNPSKIVVVENLSGENNQNIVKDGNLLRLGIDVEVNPIIPGIDLEKRDLNKLKTETRLGPQWFNMKSHEMTDDIKQDMAVMRARGYIDPKQHFRKGAQSKEFPKIFQ